jgi:plastocyanin
MNASIATRLASLGMAAAMIACGNKSPTVPSPGSLPPVQTNTITLTSSGANPRNVEIAVGSRVLFVNNDSKSHNMASDPHPEHTQCPELNQIGFLSAGQSRETGNLVTPKSCGFHDHDSPSTGSLQGLITAK